MNVFSSPGLADANAPDAVLVAWNALVKAQVSARPASPILELDPRTIANGQTLSAVRWPGHPLEPLNCQSEEVAEKLCDWAWAGRAELHNEYLEYTLLMQLDANGALRPKRFVATTELMEWWQTMAVVDPDFFLSRIETVSGVQTSMNALFGLSKAQWLQLSVETRKKRFGEVMVGDGRATPPLSRLNREHALFMSHPINGLDDLIYVVHFGSFPYAVKEPSGARRRARIEEIFAAENVGYLFCRNADPAAAEGAYNQAFIKGSDANPQARKLAFADPLGMYMHTFSSNGLRLNGGPVPAAWTKWSRGDANQTPQRLVFGPADSEPQFLDDLRIGSGPDAPRVNGYQLAKLIEVGPLVVVGEQAPLGQFNDIPAVPVGTIACGGAQDGRCQQIAAFKAEFDAQESLLRGTRGGHHG